jgi:hypothetical protein
LGKKCTNHGTIVSIGASNNSASFRDFMVCYLKNFLDTRPTGYAANTFFNTDFIGGSNSNNSAESRGLVQFFFFTPLRVKTHEAAICNFYKFLHFESYQHLLNTDVITIFQYFPVV